MVLEPVQQLVKLYFILRSVNLTDRRNIEYEVLIMSKHHKALLPILITLIAISVLSACNSKTERTPYPDVSYGFPIDQDPDSVYYSSTKAAVSEIKNASTYSSVILPYQDGICVLIRRETEDLTPLGYDMHIICRDGTERKTCELDTKWAISFCNIDDEYLISACPEEGIRKFDFNGNRLGDVDADIGSLGNITSVTSYSQGFVVCGINGVITFDKECRECDRFRVDDGFSLVNKYSVFEQGGDIYVIASLVDGECIMKADNTTGRMDEIDYIADITGKGDIAAVYAGPYIKYDDSDYYCIYDAESNDFIPITKSTNMLIIPEPLTHYAEPEVVFLSNGLIVVYYTYSDYVSPDFIIAYRDDDSNYGDRKEIIVKGYGATRDSGLKSAAYQYNVSQDEFFVRIEEFGNEFLYDTEEEAQNVQLKLMQEFQSDDAPDIYYGDSFDYDYWGSAGIVIDMAPYLAQCNLFDRGKLSSNIIRMMTSNDGTIYQVFSGYSLVGYWGDEEQYSSNTYPYNNLPSLYPNQRRTPGIYSDGIVDVVLRIPFRDMCIRGEMPTEDEIRELLQFAVEHGNNPSSYVIPLGPEMVGKRLISMFDTYVGLADSYHALSNDMGVNARYIGAPSFEGSTHPINPEGLVAVSAGSDNPEACCRFISYLFSDETQEQVLLNGWIPVNNEIMNTYLGYMTEPTTIPDDKRIYSKLLLRDNNRGVVVPFSEAEKALYLEALASADMILSFDWGVKNIIVEEIDDYYRNGSSIEDVARVLYSRLSLYAAENYQ
ncbi:hypothetical protein SAMN02910456_02721 [Ruminococcaceae bacterium YRB3002]|nr:hypothetical protein SAMN02910456_02721 [Ruminococcaceae bacterium YRB3002]